MTYLVIDTCVWLDLAKSPNDEPIIIALEELEKKGKTKILIPQIIIDEFDRNKDRIIESGRQRMTQEFKKVRKAVEEYCSTETRQIVIEGLDDVNHRLPIIADKVIESVGRIEGIFSRSEKLTIEDGFYINAAKRALEKKAPFHKQKNSIADALIMEAYIKISHEKDKDRCYFITHNTHDFSSLTDDRNVHEDYSMYFDGKSKLYSINIRNVLNEIDSDIVEEVVFENEFTFESRSLTEILESIDEFEQKIWYGRHGVLADSVRKKKVKIVDKKSTDEYNSREITREIWEAAEAAARKVEERFPEDHGPWNDFEWGMLSGKLSTLRWILGDDWDMLDT
jgi:hypothetical protein